jgi:hypothetical protein
MPQHPFPDPGPDNEEPDRSPLPSGAEGDGPAEQGLHPGRPRGALRMRHEPAPAADPQANVIPRPYDEPHGSGHGIRRDRLAAR